MSRTIHSSTPPRNTHPLIHPTTHPLIHPTTHPLIYPTTHPLIYPTTKHALIYPTTQSQRLFETHWCEAHWCETLWCDLGGSVPNAALLVAIQFESNCIATWHKLYRVTCIHLHVTHSSKRDSNCIESHLFISTSLIHLHVTNSSVRHLFICMSLIHLHVTDSSACHLFICMSLIHLHVTDSSVCHSFIATWLQLYRVTLKHLNVTNSSKRYSNCIESRSFIYSSPPSQQSVATWTAACQNPTWTKPCRETLTDLTTPS